MKTIDVICDRCKEEIKVNAKVCKHCGAEQDTEKNRLAHNEKVDEHNRKHNIKYGIYFALWAGGSYYLGIDYSFIIEPVLSLFD